MATGTMTQVPSLPGSSRSNMFFDSVFRRGTMDDRQGRPVGVTQTLTKGEQKPPVPVPSR